MGKQFEDSFFDEPQPSKPARVAKSRAPRKTVDKPTAPEKVRPVFKSRAQPKDFDMAYALEVLDHYQMLSAEVKLENQEYLDPYYKKPTLAQRVRDWRERRAT